jgi:hypothetical protein
LAVELLCKEVTAFVIGHIDAINHFRNAGNRCRLARRYDDICT